MVKSIEIPGSYSLFLDCIWSNYVKSIEIPICAGFLSTLLKRAVPCRRAPGDHHDGSFWMSFLGQNGHKRLARTKSVRVMNGEEK